MPTTIVAALLAAWISQTAPDPSIQVEVRDSGGWRLTVTVEGTSDPRVAQARLAPRAAELCDGEFPRFGRYRFSADELAPGQPSSDHVDSVTLIQDVDCGDEVAAAAPAPRPAPSPLSPVEADRLTPGIFALSAQYFAAIDEARDADAFAMATEEMTGGGTLADWTAREDRLRLARGAPVSRTMAKVTWYSNPLGVAPGYYSAVDFVAAWEHQDECGYIVWYSPDGAEPFRLVRQETTALPHELDAPTRASLRQAHCILL